jgi:hypothetical protein
VFKYAGLLRVATQPGGMWGFEPARHQVAMLHTSPSYVASTIYSAAVPRILYRGSVSVLRETVVQGAVHTARSMAVLIRLITRHNSNFELIYVYIFIYCD